MKIVVSPPAREDLKQAYQQITEDNPKAADRMLARIIEVIGMLASGSVEGREVRLRDGRPPQLLSGHPRRRAVIRRDFPESVTTPTTT